MASISSLSSVSYCPRSSHHFTSFSNINTVPHVFLKPKSERSLLLFCKKNNYCQGEEEPIFYPEETSGNGTKRREALLNLAVTAVTLPAIFSYNAALAETAVAENFRVYTDDANKFQISIPQDWQVGAGDSGGFKSLTAFYPETSSSSSVSVAITGLGPDFTKLESFGKVDEFAETLIGGLDRSWQRPPGVAAKLIDSKAAKGFYYIEYTMQNPGESRRHLLSALGIAFNGWYNRLYTVTGQFVDEEAEQYSSMVRKAVSSFRFI